MLSPEYLTMITTGFLVGSYARVATIQEDFRQYPSYPNGYLINLVTGCVAAMIGAVFLPGLLTNNFVSVSFLALAIQQFRDVRKMERSALIDLENSEYSPRGHAYIDGIAKTFEARNYLALVTAFLCTLTMKLIPGHRPLPDIIGGLLAGLAVLYLLRRLTKGKTVGDIAEIRLGKISIEQDSLYVDDMFVHNVGLPDVQERFLKEGVAVTITPHDGNAQIALANYGQRQAIVHEAVRTLGLKRYVYQRRDFEHGRICFALIPIRQDRDLLLKLVRSVPLLESTRKSKRMRNPE
ncbi:MAG: YIEGIA domain-containing protein, partial [Tumebacillaceae bacterium]